MKKNHLIACFVFSAALLLPLYSVALSPLTKQRTLVLKQYVHYLGKGDYKTIPSLFAADGLATSSSGISSKPDTFYRVLFTKTISQPNAVLNNIFYSNMHSSQMVILFNFSWKNLQGKRVSSKFLDLVQFEKGTSKIKQLFVFGNTFQRDIMKQLEAS